MNWYNQLAHKYFLFFDNNIFDTKKSVFEIGSFILFRFSFSLMNLVLLTPILLYSKLIVVNVLLTINASPSELTNKSF